ncbi:MAG: YdcF family protein [Clostridia bacterium]|nr:YdcF family protein [Clostridia bacterium]
MKKRIKIIVIILICFIAIALTVTLGVNAYLKASVENQILTAEGAMELTDVDCILVLGCLVRPDGTPSGMLEDRLTTGVELWETGVSDTLLMSGDHGTKEYDEVNSMRNFAVERGVPVERVFMDHAGFCTYDSIYRLKEVFKAKKVVIVTQEYHLYRALYIANALGIEAWGVPADLHRYYGQIRRDLREIVARNKDFLYCIFKPLPKYLGDTIDLNGDGRVTEG